VVEGEGLLEISSKGFGFLRQADTDFQQAPNDVFVTPEVVRAYGLRDGMWLKCAAREGNRGPQLTELLQICGKNPEECRDLPYFEELTVINPDKRMVMETRRDRYTTRVIDLISTDRPRSARTHRGTAPDGKNDVVAAPRRSCSPESRIGEDLHPFGR